MDAETLAKVLWENNPANTGHSWGDAPGTDHYDYREMAGAALDALAPASEVGEADDIVEAYEEELERLHGVIAGLTEQAEGTLRGDDREQARAIVDRYNKGFLDKENDVPRPALVTWIAQPSPPPALRRWSGRHRWRITTPRSSTAIMAT